MLQSPMLAGNARLESAAGGGPSVKKAPPADDPDAVARIQKALVALGFSLPRSFPAGEDQEPDGKFGDETHSKVIAFQKQVFPNAAGEWDGRCGPKTLAKMDEALLADSETVTLRASNVSTSNCQRA
jgi:peptidoglycan hydrolase-like protein with peptidoglycan-binding domain